MSTQDEDIRDLRRLYAGLALMGDWMANAKEPMSAWVARADDTGHKTLPPDSCETCGGIGMVGHFVGAESGYQDDPCPDCEGSGAARPQEG